MLMGNPKGSYAHNTNKLMSSIWLSLNLLKFIDPRTPLTLEESPEFLEVGKIRVGKILAKLTPVF